VNNTAGEQICEWGMQNGAISVMLNQNRPDDN